MDNGQKSFEQPTKKRGRPRNTQQTALVPTQERSKRSSDVYMEATVSKANGKRNKQSNTLVEDFDPTLAPETFSSLSSLLQNLMRHDRAEIARAAKELEVSENTIYRWMKNSSEPRPQHLRRLPDVFPERRRDLIDVINRKFPGVIDTSVLSAREIQKDIYQRIIDLVAVNDEVEIRLWLIYQKLFEYALLQMDPEHQGLAITYAKLMPPHHDGIYSLREEATRYNPPWSRSSEAKAYLGATTLAGRVASLQRMQTWSDQEECRFFVDVEEGERSACAAPVMRGRHRLAGVLVASSTNPLVFKNLNKCEALIEYAKLLAVAVPEHEFYSVEQINLHPMPNLHIQRAIITETYINRVIVYVRTYGLSRRDAERHIQRAMEVEFDSMVLQSQ